jgi:hypothetical protein
MDPQQVLLRRASADITPGGYVGGAPVHHYASLCTASTTLLSRMVPFYSARSNRSFLAILLLTDSRLCIYFVADPLRLCGSISRAIDVSLQHVRARTSFSSSRSSRLGLLLQITQIALSAAYMERPREPLLLCTRRRRAEFP